MFEKKCSGYPIPEEEIPYFKKLIHDTRVRYDLSTDELGDLIFLSGSMIRKMESLSDHHPIDLCKIKDMSRVFQDDFFTNEYQRLVRSLNRALLSNDPSEKSEDEIKWHI